MRSLLARLADQCRLAVPAHDGLAAQTSRIIEGIAGLDVATLAEGIGDGEIIPALAANVRALRRAADQLDELRKLLARRKARAEGLVD